MIGFGELRIPGAPVLLLAVCWGILGSRLTLSQGVPPPLPCEAVPGGDEETPDPPRTQTSPTEEPAGAEQTAQPPGATPAPQTAPAATPPPPKHPLRPRRPRTLSEKYADLVRRMAALEPRGVYLLVDTGTNRLYMMRGRCILRAAVCSTGSGRFLPDPPRKREWTFDTPKGEFRIQRKFLKPVWIKPDWAFIEEGEPLPKSLEERMAPEELGDYALDLGDGYLIHGTLYERALGLSVTHGCIRLGAEDLEAIFRSVRVGTRVYIF